MTEPSAAPTLALGEDTLDSLSGLAAGNDALVARPGLLTSLQQGNATPQQASTVNAFLVGLQGLRAVELAQKTGTKVSLSSQEQNALTGMNVDYSSVNYNHDTVLAAGAPTPGTAGQTGGGSATPADPTAQRQAAQQYTSQIAQALIAGDNAKVAQIATEAKAAGVNLSATPSTGDGWFSSAGSFLHHLTHNVASDAITKGWNTVDAVVTLGEEYSNPGDTQQALRGSLENVEAMKALGYDPNNPLSVAAYTARGLMHDDSSDLAKKWDDSNAGLFGWSGDQAVIEATKFGADPNAYIKNIAASKTLTDEQKHAILSSPTFSNLVAEVQGRQASIGNKVARDIGLDPVKHPTAFAYTSAGTDLAASFVLDPTNALVGAGLKAVKVSQIGLNGINDGEKIRKIMDPANGAWKATQVRRGWQSMMDDAAKVREGLDSGTDAGKVAAAQAMAHARAATPSIADMMPDLLGNKLDLTTNTVTHGDPIATWGDLTDYLASKAHMLRLTRGKAAIESDLMPGAVSKFSYRWVKGALAANTAGRSVTLNLDREANAARVILDPLNAVDATTGEGLKVAQNVADSGAGDFRTGTGPVNPAGAGSDVIANAEKDKSLGSLEDELNPASAVPQTPAGLASAARASELTAADRGDLLRLSRTGAGPAAQWARLKLAAQRASNFLPRNNRIILGDSDGTEKINRFARSFLTPGDAALFSAMFARGDEGVQKAVIDGIVQQVGHAAGLGTTEAGRKVLDQLSELNYQRYGHTGNEKLVDPATGMERDVALFPQQVRQEFYLPNFQTLYRASAKLGIFQQTVGRVFNSNAADVFLNYERLAMLLKPNIAWRNIIEGQGNIAVRGKYLDLLRAKALAGSGDVLTPRKTLLAKAISATALDRVGRLYKGALTRTADPEWVAGVKEFTEGQFHDEFQPTVLGYGKQMVDSSPDPLGVEDTDFIARQGWHATRYKRVGFDLEDANGVMGADRYAHALGVRFGQYPDLDRALIEASQNPTQDVSDIVDLLKTPTIKRVVDKMIRAGTVNGDGAARFATSDADKELALTKMAQLMVADTKYLLTDQQGNFIKPLADHIFETGKTPNGAWIQKNLTDNIRPKAVLAPTYRATTPNGALGFVSSLLDSSGAAYKYLVEDTIKRTTSEPAFLMNYGDARQALRSVQRDIHDNLLQPQLDRLASRRADLSDEEYQSSRAQAHLNAEQASARIAHDAAVKRAYNATEYMIDDPGLKTQADIVGKNFLMFSRAVNAFIRRWGTLAIENPAALRRGFLAVEGLHHAGLLYTDANGNVNFTYPGSDLAVQAFGKLSGLVPGLGPIVTYPVSGALSGQFNMLAPGFDNPARFSLSPMLNMPFHLVETLFPDHRSMFDEIDRAVNGQNAQGKPWYSELEPGIVTKLTSNTDESKDSAFAGAMRSAIMYLYAADPNGTKGIFPSAGATPDQVDGFLSKLRTQVKNQMYFRAIFGEFAPSPPGIQNEESKNAGLVDGLFTQAGVKNLDDEYKLLLADTGGDRAEATAIFTAAHPNRLAFTVPTTHAAVNGAYLPTTPAAGKWINDNLSFINAHKQLSAYFVPQQDGPFDLNAYEAQLETGLREHYAPDEFLKQTRITQAEAVYYDATAKRSAAYDAALTAGNTTQAKSINANFDAWKKQFLAANPMFAEKQANYAATDQQALENIGDLKNLVTNPGSLPSSVRSVLPQIQDMLNAYEAHTRFVAEHTTTNPYAFYSLKQQELASYEAYMTGVAGKNGNLTSLYNGIFKPLTYGS